MNASNDRQDQGTIKKGEKGLKYYLGDNFPGIYFTQQEARCMKHFLKGFSIARTAATLNLSPRTIEFYLTNMKCKLKCNSKAALIEKVFNSNFRNYMDSI